MIELVQRGMSISSLLMILWLAGAVVVYLVARASIQLFGWLSTFPHEYLLPDGTRFWGFLEREVMVLYNEMFVLPTRLSHGLHLEPGATVMDVGANLGMFARYLNTKVPDVSIHAFEPIPQTCELLRRNMAAHKRVVVHEVGLGKEAARVRGAKFNARWTTAATSLSDLANRDVTIAAKAVGIEGLAGAFVTDAENMGSLPKWLTAPLRVMIDSSVLHWVGVVCAASLMTLEMFLCDAATVSVDFDVVPTSEAIRSAGLKQIDLLKIDVEGMELDVLQGIAEDQWDGIRQVWIEAHAWNVEPVRQLLEARGFHVEAEQEDFALLKLYGIWILYAHRAAADRPDRSDRSESASRRRRTSTDRK